jgi:hypothetical protein
MFVYLPLDAHPDARGGVVDLDELFDLVRAVARLDEGSDRAGCEKLTRLRAWCDSREVRAGRVLVQECAYPEKVMADAARSSLRDARKVMERATTLDEVPSFECAMAAGQVGAAHLDVVGTALRQFDGEERRELATRLDRLVGVASVATPDEWARRVRAEIQKVDDDDGEKRHARQRAAMRLSSRVDRVTGMGKLWASLDPLSFVKVSNRIDALVEALFAEQTPEGCPSDPIEKQAYLRALAFVALCEGRGAAMARPEFTIVIDTRSLDDKGRPVIDWGLPVDVPPSVLADLFDDADVEAVIVRGGAVLHAPGRLDLGRTTRLANRWQRRALRALYPSCAIPDCPVRFSLCKVHHVKWWRHGGRTDLENLLAVCVRHHTAIHHEGWQVELATDRTLTVTLPDRTVMTTGPPARAA